MVSVPTLYINSMIKQKKQILCQTFFHTIFYCGQPYIAMIYFYFEKNKYYAKKIMGAEKFCNYIIYYADSLRHYWTANTILYCFILLRFILLLYYTHETRTRIYYYYYIITLFFFAFFFSYYSIFFFIILYSYTFAYLRKT